MTIHERFMRLALDEAAAAAEADEVPVGAVITHHGRVVAAAHNLRETLHDPTAHAEMLAITQAAEALQSWRLDGCTLYVTLEPCTMCAGALVLARISTVVFGAADPKAGACVSLYEILSDSRLNHRAELIGRVLETECGDLLRDFFRRKRSNGSTTP